MDKAEAAQQLHQIEHNLEQFSTQRKQFQNQLTEVESALEAIKDNESTYKIIGNIMVKRTAEKTGEELKERKETLGVRITSIEKQEEKLKSKVKELQETVMKK